ncbi:Dihydroneopterin triphosphate pyrophosphatase [Streptococcus cristatus]|uniref:Dihydroneopterin triphosphate pyrophosphatase n=1 Tax=Streptococcus cristatus TaxID=45634 RepID=A0A3R9KZR0_STRCR|nr:NUDIX domain-containing protein [Streptococcus cristatus]RSJ81416.1 Dihydroneopterin triphosphate pyrophosphatase [Streptococcus cristatus]RSJ81811.1 Dihydroneopterin triphosphate pyrophosphatase [Streptococcus cristatus]RSJ86876.1 Dihydroneopterin triphosphate pyrophosphatase [Streptococcus cristatus]RSJ87269.1 Dihydroneopterin triphosphate pyrophosphatase [Streptococcus cristatus]
MMRQLIESWIYHPEEREILLLKVEDEKFSFWKPITGGIESGESPEEACLREIKEETGLLLHRSNLTSLGDFMVKIDENLTIHKNLFLVLIEQKEIQISDEHVGAQWVALDKVSSQLYWPSNQATFEMISEKL